MFYLFLPIFYLFSTYFQPIFNLFSTYFEPILNLFSTYLITLCDIFSSSDCERISCAAVLQASTQTYFLTFHSHRFYSIIAPN